MTTTHAPAPQHAPTIAPAHGRSVVVSAAAVAVLVLTGFAMIAIVPVALVVRGTLRDPRLSILRPWAGLLAAVYATPLLLWAALPDRAPSLTKDMHPAFVPAIIGAAVLFLAAYVAGRPARRLPSPS